MEYINEIKNFGTQIHLTWVVVIAPGHGTCIIYDKRYDITHYDSASIQLV